MKNQTPIGQQDAPWGVEGDAEFIGVDERTYAPHLRPGMVARAVNMRFRNKRAEPRLGDAICQWMPDGGQTTFTETYCAAVFANPDDGLEWIVVAGTTGGSPAIYALRPNNDGKLLTTTLPSGAAALSASTCVQFVQCMNVLVLLRGADEAPLVCTSLDEGFKAIAQTASGTGTQAISNSSFGLYYKNRLLVIKDRDEVAVSDLLDYTRYTPVLSEFKINKGNNDALVAIAPFTDTTLIMFKDQSILRVDNVYGDLSSVRLGDVTNEYGCVSPWSVVRMGNDLAWLSEKGIVTLKLTELNQIQSTQAILSAPMERTMDRVNWPYAAGRNGGSGAVAAYWDGKLYMAVPLDNAELLDAELVSGSYSAGGTLTVNVTSGAEYRYAQGSSADTSLTNGTETVYGDNVFTAQGASVTLNGTAETASTASLKKVLFKGVNNAVLVYDTQNQAWCGFDQRQTSDTRNGLNIHRWVTFTYQDKLRLGYFDRFGYLRLYEEGFKDDILDKTPAAYYADVYVHEVTPTNNDTLQVNGGTTVLVNTGFSTNLGPIAGFGRWGVSGGYARDNIWIDRLNQPGFNQSGSNPWLAPNTTPQQKSWGVRFLATNGANPTVLINGGAASTTGFYGTNSWAYVDYGMSGIRYTQQAVQTELITRGYRGPADRKRFRECLVSLQTWAPTYSITTLTDGVNESFAAVSGRTRSRTTYDTAGTAAWVETNASLDWATARRQDYSVVPDNVTGTTLGTAGINFDQHQEMTENFPINEGGAWIQVKITGTAGRVEVNSIQLAATASGRKPGVLAA